MARAYDTATPRTQPEGVQVAGIFDLLKLGQMIGRNFDDVADAARRGDPGAWFDNRVFLGLDNNPRVEIPDAFYNGPLEWFPEVKALEQEGPTLQEYLSGTEVGDMLGSSVADYRVGLTRLPGYNAGARAPIYSETGELRRPGLLAINEGFANRPNDINRLLEHEGTHVAQDILEPASGGGTTRDFTERLTQYFDDNNVGPQNFRFETVDMLPVDQRDKIDLLRYIHAAGEAEARAAERAYLDEAFGMRPPTREDYARNEYGLPFRTDLMYNLTPEVGQAATNYWYQLHPTPFNTPRGE
jgi:hypothetical protein